MRSSKASKKRPNESNNREMKIRKLLVRVRPL